MKLFVLELEALKESGYEWGTLVVAAENFEQVVRLVDEHNAATNYNINYHIAETSDKGIAHLTANAEKPHIIISRNYYFVVTEVFSVIDVVIPHIVSVSIGIYM